MKNLRGAVCAITGAGSGIGRATAVLLATKGADVALSDVNERGLRETADACRAKGAKVSARRVDVAKRDEVYAWADEVVAHHGKANVIVNNAGVALGATVEDMRYEDLEWLMGINFWGVVYGTKAFLPKIRAAGEGHVVNISSVFGLIAVPTQSAYNAAKFAVKGFTEALREELVIEGAPIGVTCVHPGGIKTNIARAARMTETPGWTSEKDKGRMEAAFRTTPDEAALTIVRAIEKNQRRLLIGADAHAIDLVQRLLPESYQDILIAGGRMQRRRSLGR